MAGSMDLSLSEVAERLRDGSLRARDLAEEALERMRLGAYAHVDADLTRRHADWADAAFEAGFDLGPLQGIPMSVKDLFGVPGLPTRAGSPRRLPARYERAGPVVSAALAQRAVVTGKTHTVEFAFGGLGPNPHHRTPPNPWDAAEERAPGGSSSGAGVSLCEGSALLALGTDTAGSVRIPAAWTGNVGLRPTAGRWSTEGVVPLSPTLDTPGLVARTVRDLATGFVALDPGHERPPEVDPSGLRVARCDTLVFEDCSPGVVRAVEDALGELERAGVRLEAMAMPEVDEAWSLFKRGGPVSIELHHFLCTELPDWVDTLDPNVRARLADAAKLGADEYVERLALLGSLAAAAEARLRDVAAVVAPTVATTPPRLADVATAPSYARQNLLALRNAAVFAYLGLTAATVPVGLDDAGMPVGLQIIGRAHSDPLVVGIALGCERILGEGSARLGVPPRLGT